VAFRPSVQTAQFLVSDKGKRWLANSADLATSPEAHLASITSLRQHLEPNEAAAIMEQVRSQSRAANRFDHASAMLFTDVGFQQSTHKTVAAHRARRFRGCALVADMGCGIGSDTIALAQVADHILALDRDAVNIVFARHNSSVYGLAGCTTFVQADVLRAPLMSLPAWFFFDPGRRTETGRRVFRPEDYEPSLSLLWELYGSADGLAIKVGPGINYQTLPWVDEVEVISLNGQVKEATLWCKNLATAGVRRRATLLPSGITLTDTGCSGECAVQAPGRYIFEPDPAVIRAGLVRNVGANLGLWQIDRRIAYLSGDSLCASLLVQAFEIEECLPFGVKTIRKILLERDVGVLEMKKRGIGVNPDDLRRQLKVRGIKSRTLVLTRVGDRPVAFLCKRIRTSKHGKPRQLPVLSQHIRRGGRDSNPGGSY
jgi:hypothetical protein